MRIYTSIFFLLSAVTLPVSTLKALIIAPDVWYSHLALNGRLADILVEAGHYVNFLMPVSGFPISNNGTKLAQKITRYPPSKERIALMKDTVNSLSFQDNPFEMDKQIFSWSQKSALKNILLASYIDMLTDRAFLEQLKAEKFDVGIAEYFDISAFALFHCLEISTTITTSAIPLFPYLAHALGIPKPLYVPATHTAPHQGVRMSTFERMMNLYESESTVHFYTELYREVLEDIGKIHGTSYPSFDTLMRRCSFLFINTNEHLEIARPIFSKVKYFGGIGVREPQSLDKRTEAILEKSKRGVVLISFGSIVEGMKMPSEVREAFFSAFRRFPDFEFIWKFTGNATTLAEMFRAYPNVHPFDWIDQRSILAHPKTKAFISHCGLNSFNEAAFSAVPLLCIPFFGDQNYNAAAMNHHQIGIVIEKNGINKQSISEALDQLLNSQKYSRNAKNVKRKLDANPFKPDDIFLRYVEFAAKFDDHFEELNLFGAEMNFLEYFGLDFILPTLLLTFALVVLIIWITVRICLGSTKSKSKLE